MIILKDAQGREREVLEGLPYRLQPGEYVFGSTAGKDQATLATALEAEGIQWGDLMASGIKAAKLDKLFGKTNCTACVRRQQILNRIGTIGLKETIRQIKETLDGPR